MVKDNGWTDVITVYANETVMINEVKKSLPKTNWAKPKAKPRNPLTV